MDLAFLTGFIQIVVIDISLAADNAIVIGMAAAGLPEAQRKRAILLGLAGATVLRIVLAIFATKLLHVTGLTVAGGFLLLWVSWKMFEEIRHMQKVRAAEKADKKPKTKAEKRKERVDNAPKKLSAAVMQILVADLGMSLDNIIAVAGVARDHYVVLALGLILSVALMGLAATLMARLLHRWPWFNWVGMFMVLYVAIKMIWEGSNQVILAYMQHVQMQ